MMIHTYSPWVVNLRSPLAAWHGCGGWNIYIYIGGDGCRDYTDDLLSWPFVIGMPLLDQKVLGDGDMMGIFLLGDIDIVLMISNTMEEIWSMSWTIKHCIDCSVSKEINGNKGWEEG
jgi:hypothetical protein